MADLIRYSEEAVDGANFGETVRYLLRDLVDPRYIEVWLACPNAAYGMKSPQQMLESLSREERVKIYNSLIRLQ